MTRLIKSTRHCLTARLICLALFIASLSLAFTADLQASESVIQLLRAMQQAWASGEFKKCVALGDKLIAIDSKFADAYYYRGCAKSQLHDSVSALKDLDYYCKNSKGSKIEPLTYKIQCYVDTQQWSKALECIDQANAIKPQGHLYKTKAQIYRQLNDNKAATSCLLKAVQIAPRDYWCWRELVSCYCTANLYKQALEASKHLIELRPDEPDGHGLRSKIYTKLGMTKEAKAELELCNQKADFPF